MANFFDRFPIITYDISKGGKNYRDAITDVFFRLKFNEVAARKRVLYFSYTVGDHETPELIANSLYNDPEAHWVILLLNNVVDPYIDWYMNDATFTRYINAKYGSISAAVNTIHHYEKKTSIVMPGIEGGFLFTNTYSTIDGSDIQGANTFSTLYPDIPYENYTDLPDLTFTNVAGWNNEQVEVSITKEVVTCYDYEALINDEHRQIKLIRPETYPEIRNEFETLLANYNPSRRINFKGLNI